MDFKDGAPFDPGFSKYIVGFQPQVEYFSQKFNQVQKLQQKKFEYRLLYSDLKKILNTQIAFYLGCLFWALYIKQFENKPIINNPCICDNYSKEIHLFEVNYMPKFLTQIKRDAKYYLNTDFVLEDFKLKIIDKYTEFLKMNKAFTIELTTDTLQVPKLKKASKKTLDTAFKIIKNVCETGKFEELYTIADKLV